MTIGQLKKELENKDDSYDITLREGYEGVSSIMEVINDDENKQVIFQLL